MLLNEKLCFIGITKLNIHTDSTHLKNSATQWMPKWESNGWKTSSGAPVANRGELERFADAKRGMDVTFVRILFLYIAKSSTFYFNLCSSSAFKISSPNIFTDIMHLKVFKCILNHCFTAIVIFVN